MQNIMLGFRQLFAGSLVASMVVLSTGCNHGGASDAHKESETNQGAIKDSCGVCSMDSFLIEPSYKVGIERIVLNQPVAIQFFNQARLADKYEKSSYDTLMKLFKMKHWGDRNLIYALKNQYFYFETEIKPFLIKNSVTIMDSVPDHQLLEFRGANFSVVVDPNDYKSQDGVIFFLPGKKPVFWTADRGGIYCKDSDGLAVQYFLCLPESK